jgi:hypothetical protein
VAAAFVAVAAMGSCTNVGTAPNAIVSLAFDTLPYPSVVAGDTLRDSLGRAAALHALAYNADGNLIANPALQYLALDSGVDIDASGYLVATTLTSGSVRVVAAAASLQSLTKTVIITREPSLFAVSANAVDTVKYTLDSATNNLSPALTVKLTRDSAGVPVGVPGFLVSWQVTFHGAAIANNDLTASLWDDAKHTSALDTTSADGTAARSLRIRSILLPPASADSFVVFATTRYLGLPVAGSPARFVIHFRPR